MASSSSLVLRSLLKAAVAQAGFSRAAALSGLTCGTSYNFRVRASNSAGTALGGNQTFTTAA